jgi:hypothetical protein
MPNRTRELKMPKDIQEGTANHVQMIINDLESGDTSGALYLAIDLQDQLIGKEPALVVTRRYPPLDHLAIEKARKEAHEEGFRAGRRQAQADAVKKVTAKVTAALRDAEVVNA